MEFHENIHPVALDIRRRFQYTLLRGSVGQQSLISRPKNSINLFVSNGYSFLATKNLFSNKLVVE